MVATRPPSSTPTDNRQPRPGNPEPFLALADVTERLERVLAASVADETEIVWLQRRRGWADNRGDGHLDEPLLSVLVRVIEGGRAGWYRTETAITSELENAVRYALALAKGQPRVKRRPMLPAPGRVKPPAYPLYDHSVAQLDPEEAQRRLRAVCTDEERAHLGWSEARLAVFNSHGMRRSAAATEVTFELATGEHPGAGHTAISARTWDGLDLSAARERAHERAASPDAEVAPAPTGGVPVLLAPEATAELLDLVNTHAFSARAYLEGTSFLSRHRNVQVFDRRFSLADDGTNVQGLPFPFDFEGSPKKRLKLIQDGKPSTPALSVAQGAEAGLAPTAQAVGGRDAFFGHLFLQPGTASEQDLLDAADGGIRIGWIDHSECFEPEPLHVRMTARGIRRIENGSLGAPIPDLVWEESLLGALARLLAVGSDTAVRATRTTILGAISAPSLVLAEAQRLDIDD
ncbi:MAG: metallopeptidase TldD-related protein [Acidobacteriota bacterium]